METTHDRFQHYELPRGVGERYNESLFMYDTETISEILYTSQIYYDSKNAIEGQVRQIVPYTVVPLDLD